MTKPTTPHRRFRLTLAALPDAYSPEQRLKLALKHLLRVHRLRCTDIREVSSPEGTLQPENAGDASLEQLRGIPACDSDSTAAAGLQHDGDCDS
jgi:hypothetical protein